MDSLQRYSDYYQKLPRLLLETWKSVNILRIPGIKVSKRKCQERHFLGQIKHCVNIVNTVKKKQSKAMYCG